MDKRRLEKLYFLLTLAAIITSLLFVVSVSSVSALADGEITVEATCATSVKMDGDGRITYTWGDWGEFELTSVDGKNFSSERKASRVRFRFGTPYPYYRVNVGRGSITTVGQTMTADNGIAYYDLPENYDGDIVVAFLPFSDPNTPVTEREIDISLTVDNGAPTLPYTEAMAEWLRVGMEYNVVLDLMQFSDSGSGRGELWYALFDKNGNILPGEGGKSSLEFEPPEGYSLIDVTTDNKTFTLTDNTTLKLIGIDRALNVSYSPCEYSKFDGTAPDEPAIELTPNVDLSLTGGFAKTYEVTIDYRPDSGSGLADSQFYKLNGNITQYSGPFTLTPGDYEIVAYSYDKVGNRSDDAEYKLYQSAFDIDPPSFSRTNVIIDIRKENCCEIDILFNDSQSGVRRAYITENSAELIEESEDFYIVSFNGYGMSRATVVVTDMVGNENINAILLPFGDSAMTEKFRQYGQKYIEADFSKYTAETKADIDSAYEKLNALILNGAQTGDLQEAFNDIDALFSGESGFVFRLESSPIYISGALTFDVELSDFPDYRFGEKITVTLKAADSDGNNYVSLAGFGKGFTDYFELSIRYNGEQVSELANGIKIRLNLPAGYYERNYALFDIASGEKIETEKIDNKLEFYLKKDSAFALAVSGSTEKSGTGGKDVKYISVFGRKLSYGAFFGTIFGVAGALIIGIVVTIIIRVRRNGRYR